MGLDYFHGEGYADTMSDRVEVYWNLHKKTFSYRPIGGRVQHTDGLILNKPLFVVQPAGRERVLREKRKNVHAYVRGLLHFACDDDNEVWAHETVATMGKFPKVWTKVRYNPYVAGTFLDPDNNPVLRADVAVLACGLIYAIGVR